MPLARLTWCARPPRAFAVHPPALSAARAARCVCRQGGRLSCSLSPGQDLLEASCAALPPFQPLLLSDRLEIYSNFRRMKFEPGAVVATAGLELSHFHVVETGTVAGSARSLGRGERLGELGMVSVMLATDTWRGAGVTGATTWGINRRNLRDALSGAAARRRQRAVAAIAELPLLGALTRAQTMALADVARRSELEAGAAIALPFLHIIVAGQVRLLGRAYVARRRTSSAPLQWQLSGEAAASQLPEVLQPGDAYGEAAALARGLGQPLPPGADSITAVTKARRRSSSLVCACAVSAVA